MAKGLTILSDFHINRCRHGSNFASIKVRLSIAGLTVGHKNSTNHKGMTWFLDFFTIRNYFIYRHYLGSDKANQSKVFALPTSTSICTTYKHKYSEYIENSHMSIRKKCVNRKMGKILEQALTKTRCLQRCRTPGILTEY